MQTSGPVQRLNSLVVEKDQRICISSIVSCNADATDQRTTATKKLLLLRNQHKTTPRSN